MTLQARPHKECAVCGNWFHPHLSTQRVCSLKCAKRHKAVAAHQREGRKRRAESAQRNRAKLTRDAQDAVNAYVRIRDAGKPCISCGITTGQMHAGHYRHAGMGKGSQLRFSVLQIRGQCAQCNNHKSGNQVEYRKALVGILGEDRVEQIETDNRTRKYSLAELKRIAAVYKRKGKHYQRLNDEGRRVTRGACQCEPFHPCECGQFAIPGHSG